ncbi:MAG: hypothetical protein A3K09_02220 [Nitrospinae bacterium RIFCSPLOWO2_12_FULL_47_7]|nr:MAG: hypothetical protein A3K09_02220 [Nitrospinae bacterium RIFCSPLOWO2_12_FULL_47_7]
MEEQKRFIDNGNGTIKDTKTNLMWMKNDSYQDLKVFIGFDTSQKHSAKNYLETKNKEAFAGYADWRLPTKQEAHSLFVEESLIKDSYDMDIHLDPVFPSGGGFNTWTSNTRGKITAFVLSYATGTGAHKETDASLNTSVRLVRTAGDIPLLNEKVPPPKADFGRLGSWR